MNLKFKSIFFLVAFMSVPRIESSKVHEEKIRKDDVHSPKKIKRKFNLSNTLVLLIRDFFSKSVKKINNLVNELFV